MILGIVGLAVLLGVGYFAYGPIKIALAMLEKTEFREFSGDSTDSLLAIHNALILYQDSEDQLPDASGWMDAAILRLKTADMKDKEVLKKLQRPGAAEDEYGFAFNDSLSGLHTEDLDDQGVPLVFESTEMGWSASGAPVKIGVPGGQAITAGGEVIQLPGTK